MATTGEKFPCEKCEKLMSSNQFFTYRDGTKTELCKKCLTLHVDNFDTSTFLWILEKMDVPYVESKWNEIRDKAFAKERNKINGTSVMGKYLSQMKLNQWKNYRWKDTDRLAEKAKKERARIQADKEEKERIVKEKYESGEITEAQYRTFMSTEKQYAKMSASTDYGAELNPFGDAIFMKEEELYDFGSELTENDKKYLALKWGRLYKPHEWVELEKSYNEMTESFDIQDADTINTLKFICKTNLKMNQAIDSGDLDGYQKLSRVYDSLRKSAKFTAVQNKDDNDEFVDCVGNLVFYCEKNGGAIPKYEITTPLDIIDRVIDDLKTYNKSLITEDKALARQIEDYLKKREFSASHKEDLLKAKAEGFDEVHLTDKDYEDYYDEIQKQKDHDNAIYEGDEEE